MNILEVSGVSKKHEGATVLNNVSFVQKPFQKIAIAGETGSGKSTLLKIIAGWIQPDAGQVLFEQQRVLGPDEKLLPGHPAIAYLSQHFELRNNYRVEEILDMALKLTAGEAQTIFEVCRIGHLLKRRTDQLSGGEKQRIATARLLISSPKLLLLDEPYSNLDMVHKNILKQVISDIVDRLQITCILVSHEPADMLSWADEIIVMKEGKIVQQGSPKEIYRRPVDEYTAGLFGKYLRVTPALSMAFAVERRGDTNKNMYVRPESFKLTTEENNALKGTVNKVLFLGSMYEVEVLLLSDIIAVKTDNPGIAKGDEVYVSLSQDGIWYMQPH